MGYHLINYIDDLAVCVSQSQSYQAYNSLGQLLSNLGIQEAEEKACLPTRTMEFLGIQFNIDSMTMSITAERLSEIVTLIDSWLVKRRATKRQLQSLVGKLQFVAKCIRAGRVFISRLLSILPTLRLQHHRFHVSVEFKKDLVWWKRFIHSYNGVTIIPDIIWSSPDSVFSTDSCLTGFGGWCDRQYFSGEYPPHILSADHNINTLELLTVMLALKIWSHRLVNKRVQVYCDNMVSVHVINAGRTKDKFLLAILREILFICAKVNCQIKARHIAGQDNRLSDILSRAHLGQAARDRVGQVMDSSWTSVKVSDNMFNIDNDW
jgi:hypothetical protein